LLVEFASNNPKRKTLPTSAVLSMSPAPHECGWNHSIDGNGLPQNTALP
jgi:hypothetical protein